MKLIFAAAILAASFATSAECLKEGDTAILAGSLRQATYPGPPNYYSIQQGDAPETVWVLVLDRQSCMLARSDDGGAVYVLADHLQALQVALKNPGMAQQYAGLVGHHVEISGPLYKAESGHQHFPALIGADAIKKTFPW